MSFSVRNNRRGPSRSMVIKLVAVLVGVVLPISLIPLASVRQIHAFSETDVTQGCQELIRNGAMETQGDWRFGSTPAPGSYTADLSHAGQQSVRLGIPDGASNVFSFSTIYQTVTIPADVQEVRLSYWQRTNGDADGSDYRQILLLRANFTVLTLLNRDSTAGSAMWEEVQFDLSAYKGQTVVFYYDVYNNGGGLTMNAHIDDVSILACDGPIVEPSPTPTEGIPDTPTSQPTDKPTNTPSATETPLPPNTPTPVPSDTPTDPPTSTPVAESLTVSLDSATVTDPLQDRVDLPLGFMAINADRPLGSVALSLSYDQNLLLAVECEAATTLDMVECNLRPPGQIMIAAADAAGVSGTDGTSSAQLALLSFDLIQAEIPASEVTIQISELNDADNRPIQVTVSNGVIDRPPTCDKGDVDCDGGLGIRDALYMLQFVTGDRSGTAQVPPGPGTLFQPACDVSGDGNCDVIDATFVLQCMIGISNPLCPQSLSRPEGMRQLSTVIHPIRIEPIRAGISGVQTVGVFDELANGISGALIEIRFDPTQLAFDSCQPNTGDLGVVAFEAGACNGFYESDGSGLDSLRFAVASSNNVSGVIQLLELGFKRIGSTDAEITPEIEVIEMIDEDGNTVQIESPGQGTHKVFVPLKLR